MRLLLATRSADKAREIRQILPAGWTLMSLEDAGVPLLPQEDDVEAFDTFLENAAAKARYFAGLSGLPTLADDSGLAVQALGGAPGVRSKRFADDNAASATDLGLSGDADVDARNNALLLRKLAETPAGDRGAAYVCAAVAVFPDGGTHSAVGTCAGRILPAPRGTGGFGYDPLFQPEGYTESFGELPPEVKNSLSHRGRAFRALAVAISLIPSIDPHRRAG